MENGGRKKRDPGSPPGVTSDGVPDELMATRQRKLVHRQTQKRNLPTHQIFSNAFYQANE